MAPHAGAAGPNFILGGSGGRISTSVDGITWAAQTTAPPIASLGAAAGMFAYAPALGRIACGYSNSTDQYVAYSDDRGATWSSALVFNGTAGNAFLSDLAWSSGRNEFMLSGGTFFPDALYSSPGAVASTWTAKTASSRAGLLAWNSINSRWFRANSNNAVDYSTDGGTTWNTAVISGVNVPSAIAYFPIGANGTVLIGDNDGEVYRAAGAGTDTFGIVTNMTSTSNCTGFAYSAPLGLIVAVGQAGQVWTSPTGASATWTDRTATSAPAFPTDSNISSVAWSDAAGKFVAHSNANIAYSADGINWTAATSPFPGWNMSDVCAFQ